MIDENNFFEMFDPKDIEELNAKARKIEKDSELYYDLHLMVPHEAATQFIDTYRFALTGDYDAMSALMMFAAMVAHSLMASIEDRGEEE
jgi:hypothetical protein